MKVKRDNFVPFILTDPCCFRRLCPSASSYHDTANSHTCRSCFCFEWTPQGHLQPRCSRGWSGAGRRAGGWHGGRSSSAAAIHASPPSRGSGRGPLRPPCAAAKFNTAEALGSAWLHKHGRAQRGGGAEPGAAAVGRAGGVGPPFFPPPFPSLPPAAGEAGPAGPTCAVPGSRRSGAAMCFRGRAAGRGSA